MKGLYFGRCGDNMDNDDDNVIDDSSAAFVADDDDDDSNKNDYETCKTQANDDNNVNK